jgi:hypothetical protein
MIGEERGKEASLCLNESERGSERGRGGFFPPGIVKLGGLEVDAWTRAHESRNPVYSPCDKDFWLRKW